MFGAIAGGIASALAGGAMSKLFGCGHKAASGGIQGDVLATDNSTVGFFFFNDTATTEIYTLSLHDALPIRRFRVAWTAACASGVITPITGTSRASCRSGSPADRSEEHTLNSSHVKISY